MGSVYKVEKSSTRENHSTPLFNHEDGGIKFLRKAGKLLPDYTASHLRKQYYS
jgi:hypothetical protein